MRAFVIAMECEADAVRPWLKPDDRLYVSGIGKVNAAAATQKAICEGATEIWNTGLCGGFGDDIEVGGVYAVGKAVEYDFDLAKLNGTRVGQLNEYDTPYFPFSLPPHPFSSPIPHPSSLAPHPSSLAPHPSSLILATGDHFNDSEADYDLITKELGASLRDMEGAAIAHVCLREKVPCYSFKCVTNVAGKGSMTGQFEDNRKRCLDKLRDFLGMVL